MKATVEHDFVRFTRSGDASALGRVFDALAPKLLVLADHVGRGVGEAEDLVQATFLAALRDAARYDERRPLLRWMTGILVHRAQDARRRASVRAARELEAGAELAVPDDPRVLAETHEVAERISAAIDALAEPYREVLVLRGVHGLTPTEIAHALGRAPGTVRMQLKRGREKLREVLPRELTLSALFLVDEGPGLAGVRAAVLAEVARTIVPTLGTGTLWSAKGLLGAAALVLTGGVIAWGPWRTSQEQVVAFEGRVQNPAMPSGPNALHLVVAEAPHSSAGRAALAVETPAQPTPVVPPNMVAVGLVVTAENQPVADATVYALDASQSDLMRELAVTGPDGRFRVEGLEPEALLGARKPGFLPSGFGKKSASSLAWRPDGSGLSEPLLLVLGPGGQELEGWVVDAHGRGVPRARVLVAVDEDARERGEQPPERRDEGVDREGFFLQADDQGRFATHAVPVGRALLVARALDTEVAGVAFGLVDIERGASNRVELLLQSGARVFGHVTDRRGRGLGGLDVAAEWKGSEELGEFEDQLAPLLADVRTRTDENGRFVLAGLVPGEHGVELHAGARSLAKRRFDLQAGQSASFDLEVDPMHEVSTRVLDPEGQALAGWGLSWSVGDEGRDWALARERGLPLRTDAEGRCRLEGLDSGPLTLAVYRPLAPGEGGRRGPSRLPCAVRRDVLPGAEELVIQLSPEELGQGRLRGRWVDASGAPLAEAELWLGRAGWNGELRPLTDANGHFAIDGLAPAEYELRSEEERRYPPRALLARAALAPGETRDLGTLALPESSRLEVVLDLEAAGVFEVRRPVLRCEHSAPCAGALERSGDPGRFLSGPIDAGRHRFGLWSSDYAPVLGFVEVGAGTTSVRLPTARGDEVLFEVEITDPVSLDRLAPSGEGRAPRACLMWSLLDESESVLATLKTESAFDRTSHRLSVPLRFLPGAYVVRVLDDNRSGQRGQAEVRLEVLAGSPSGPLRVTLPRATR